MPNSIHLPTLADALAKLEAHDSLPPNQRRDMISAIKRVATYLNRSPADLPIDAPALRKALATIHPAQAGISAKSLANVKSALANALQIAGHLPPKEPKANPTDGWQEFLSHCSANHQALSLSRLVTYCCNRGIEPGDVSDEIMTAFQDHLDDRLLGKDPAKLCKELAQTWNGIVSRNNLTLARLTYEKGGQYRCRPLTLYPDSLQKEITAYLDRLSHVDIFDDDAPDKPLKPTSLRNTEAHLRQYLDGLISAGSDPQDLTTLAIAITPERMKTAFNAIMKRRGANSMPVGLHNIAATLTAIARHHLKLDQENLALFLKIKKRTSHDPKGMSQKNRERLGQFKDWQNVVRLISLPDILMERAKHHLPSRPEALLAMHAAAIAILLSCPMRAKNLAGLDLDRHIIAHRKGTLTNYTLRIEGAEVKNGEQIEVQLNNSNSKVLHRYITKFRPLISKVQGTALFPKESNGTPRTPGNLSAELKTMIYRETGLEVHIHLFRHITAYLYLKERPGQFETVRRLLKHRKLQTTMDFYAELSNQWAHDHYDEVVLSKWGGGNG